LLARLGLGACLADDMGLGKTIQVLSLLLVLREQAGDARKPSLLVAPASLLANWAAEIARFAPTLKAVVVHPSVVPADELTADRLGQLADVDLAITSYAYLGRVPWLTETSWRLAILDEAQAIKNPGAKQTRSVKALRADARIALTGTPIENRLGDLWSIFDFINRQEHHCRSAGQDGGKGFLRAEPPAGGALSADRERHHRPARQCRRDRTKRSGAGLADAVEADLQPPLAMARRRFVGGRG
jgi:superfamily II DNA or RNA helicase